MSHEHRDAQAVVDALFVVPTPERLQRLRAHAPGPRMGEVLTLLESHGVLPLVMHNFESAGVVLNEDILEEWWPTRARAYQQDAQRSQITLIRFIEECASKGVRVMLLKGASLTTDIYPKRWWRGQGDLDVLVEPSDVAAATRAAQRVGCLQSLGHLPQWWYRLTHFHLKLAPALPLLKEMEIHWHLHSEAHLMTVRTADLWSRARTVAIGGQEAWTLDPLDRILHLSTHLDRHLDGRWPSNLQSWQEIDLGRSSSSLRLKWIVDFSAAIEAIVGSASPLPMDLAERAHEWSAERALVSSIQLALSAELWDRQGLVSAWAHEVASALEAHAPGDDLHQPAVVQPRGTGRVHPWLDLRVDALGLLPRWIFPSKGYLRRRYRDGGASFGLTRVYHGVKVILWAVLSVLALPVALVGRWLLRASRQRNWAESNSPDAVLTLVARSRGEGRSQ